MILLIKLLGSICIVSGSIYFSKSINHTMEQRKKDLRCLYSLLVQLKSEIQYMCNTLPECFLRIGNGAREPFANWLGSIANRMLEKEENSFQMLWEEGVMWLQKNSALQSCDLETVMELQDKLGGEDITSQLKAIDFTLLHIEQQRTLLESELASKKKVITSFCVFAGAITLIFLL
ncbi:MAG: stage III sporulation protein AB [Eubacteriales bacterium]|nr:stage III sporulation protein AB [Eubacteriales bacterium]